MKHLMGRALGALLVTCAVRTVAAAPAADLTVEPGGRMRLRVGEDTILITSRFSHPAEKFNGLPPGFHFNTLGDPSDRHPFEEAGWKVSVEAKDGGWTVTGQSVFYRIERHIARDGASAIFRVRDTIVNTSGADLGLAIEHRIALGRPAASWWLCGLENSPAAHRCEENPTAFLVHAASGLGIVYDDDVLRNQVQQEMDPLRGALTAATRNFGLCAGASHTMQWSLYPGGTDYFDFLNAARRDWGVNYTLDGPMGFFTLVREPWLSMKGKPEAIRRYFERKRLKVLVMTPWFLYDDGYLLSREEYKNLMQDAMTQIRAVQPDVRFIACLEPSIQWVPMSLFEGTLPKTFGFGRQHGHRLKAAPPEASAALDRTVWADSLWRDEHGNAVLNTSDYGYTTPPWPAPDEVVGLQLFPVIGNYRYRQFNEQIAYLLNEVGMDGIYFDLFNYCGDITYDRWDGHTVILDAEGNIARKYALLSLLTAEARTQWVRDLVGANKVVVSNLKPVIGAINRLPVLNFNEAWSSFKETTPIPEAHEAARCQMSSPLALGVLSNTDPTNYARSVMRCVMAYLRYGALYVHYYTEIPEEGPGSGEYGVLNHMFPFTPVELRKGWVKGVERIVAGVSFETEWEKAARPAALCFDLAGRPLPAEPRVRITPIAPGRWRIQTTLKDWEEFVVVE